MRDYAGYLLAFSVSLNVGLIACMIDNASREQHKLDYSARITPPQEVAPEIRIIPPQEETAITILEKRPLSSVLY